MRKKPGSMKTIVRKALVVLLTAVIATSASVTGASACASIYVGAALTEDGAAYVARSEDLGGSINKLFFCREAGAFKAGEVYDGCYGFTWTFTHDSYAYTAFRDDNGDGVGGVCPDCGSTAENHVPYEEAGTNEKGLTVTATETLFSNYAVGRIDPLVDEGVAESEMTTVLLSECATARDAVELLLGLYDTVGAQDANGLFIADPNEIWYIENHTGHQYIALRLPDDLVFIEPNMSVVGRIDLDDADHVIASEGLIETAVLAGTFVGDEAEHIIDYRASYSDAADYPDYDRRMINGLNYLLGEEIYSQENIADSAFVISNTDAAGALTGLYTNIELTHPYDVQDVMDYYKVDPVGRPANQETHIFQIFPAPEENDAARGTIEWVSMGNDRYTVFVPCFPMLITDTWEGYRVSTAPAEFASEEPEEGRGAYAASTTVFLWDEEKGMDIQTYEGFRVLPENWRSSYYWCFDAVAELITSGAVSAEDEALVVESYAELQGSILDDFAAQRLALQDLLPVERPDPATEGSAAMARAAQELALSMYDALTGGGTPSGEALSGEAPSGEASR